MLTSALLILAPLFLGFAFLVRHRHALTLIHRGVDALVYAILALLGVSLGQLEGLAQQLGQMAAQVVMLVIALLIANGLALLLWHRWQPMATAASEVAASVVSWRRLLLGAAKPLLAVLLGVLLGYQWLPALPWVDDLATAALMLLLLLIGMQLRNAGLSLRRLLMNRQGLGIALAVAGSSLLAGLLLAPWLGLGWHQAMAVSAGFGWYSLSGIVIGDALGPAWGGVAFINDVMREIIALALIPLVIGQRPAVAIGYGGATAMDFTLPIIRNSGGLACVPVAIASGFLLSFLSPVVMAVLLGLG